MRMAALCTGACVSDANMALACRCFAFGLATDRVHAPNERYPVKQVQCPCTQECCAVVTLSSRCCVAQYQTGREAWVRLLPKLASHWKGAGAAGQGSSAASEQQSEL